MTFPTIVASNGQAFGNATEHTIGWVSSPAPGDLIVVWIGHDTFSSTITWDSLAFTELQAMACNATNQEKVLLYVHVCDGTEGTTTGLTISTFDAVTYTSLLVRNWGWFVSKQSVGNTNPPQSPEIFSPAGSDDILWLSLAGQRASGSWSAVPTGFDLANQLIDGALAGFGSVYLAMAAKNSAVASIAPGAWGASTDGPAITMAIGPSLGGGVAAVHPLSSRSSHPVN